jgi:hypothetical protein
MGNFSIKVIYENGDPAEDVSVFIDYGWLGGHDQKRTDSDGWTEFDNYGHNSGDIIIDDDEMGEYDLSDGNSYSFTI